MLGLYESVARKLDVLGLSVNAAVSQIKCNVQNHIIDKTYQKKHVQFLKEAEAKGELIYVDDEEEEHEIEVCCPKCGEKRITTPNTGITCKGCGVRIVVGEDGEIRRVI